MTEVVIKGAHGGRIEMKEGQILEIINVEGTQICDFFAFNTGDLMEALSPPHIRSVLGRIVLKVGDVLVSRYRRPMFELLEDPAGSTTSSSPRAIPKSMCSGSASIITGAAAPTSPRPWPTRTSLTPTCPIPWTCFRHAGDRDGMI